MSQSCPFEQKSTRTEKQATKVKKEEKNTSAPKEQKKPYFKTGDITKSYGKSSRPTGDYSKLYQLQFKACQLVKNRNNRLEKRSSLEKASQIHSNILILISNYEALNSYDQTLSSSQRQKNKMELREIKLSSILLRMKCYKKLQKYEEALADAQKLWGLMSPSEHS